MVHRMISIQGSLKKELEDLRVVPGESIGSVITRLKKRYVDTGGFNGKV